VSAHVPMAKLVDWAALGKVVWISLAAGVGVITAFALTALGAARAGEFRRGDRTSRAVAYSALAVAGLLVCGLAMWQGYLFVVKK
jgi:hypothetical protein